MDILIICFSFFGFMFGCFFGAAFLIFVNALQDLPSPVRLLILNEDGEETDMEILKDNQQESFTLEVDDAKGFATTSGLDAAPVWSVDDSSIATVLASDDGLSCVLSGVAPGQTKLNVSASVGGKAIVGSADIQIIPGDAASLQLKGSAPVDQAPAAPVAP